MEIIAYHGTSANFDEFKLSEFIGPDSHRTSILGYLGICFTESKALAKCFAKEKWDIKTSPYRPGARLITVKLIIDNPRISYPLEHVYLPRDPRMMVRLRHYYQYIQKHDSVILEAQKDDERYHTKNPETFPYISEYITRQYFIFDPTKITILDSVPIKTSRKPPFGA